MKHEMTDVVNTGRIEAQLHRTDGPAIQQYPNGMKVERVESYFRAALKALIAKLRPRRGNTMKCKYKVVSKDVVTTWRVEGK